MNNQFEAVDLFRSTLRTMIQTKDSSDSVNTVEQEQITKKGKMVNGKFITFQEIDQQRHEMKKLAMQLVSDARKVDVEGKKSFKHNGNFDGVFKSNSEKELNKKLNGDDMGASITKLMVEDKVKINYPMATEKELKSFEETGSFGRFDLLR